MRERVVSDLWRACIDELTDAAKPNTRPGTVLGRHMNESKIERFRGSKLASILKFLELQITDIAWELCERSVNEFREFVFDFCGFEGAVVGEEQETDVQKLSAEVEEEKAPAKKEEARVPKRAFAAKSPPLFSTTMTLSEGKIGLTSKVEEVEKFAVTAIEQCVSIVEELKGIETEVMFMLGLPPRSLIDFERDEHVSELKAACESAKAAILQALEHAQRAVNVFLARYETAAFVDTMSTDEVKKFLDNKPTHEDFVALLQRLSSAAEHVQSCSLCIDDVSLFRIDCTDVRERIESKAHTLQSELFLHLTRILHSRNVRIAKHFREILKAMERKPTNEEELVEFKEYIEISKTTSAELEKEVGLCGELRLVILHRALTCGLTHSLTHSLTRPTISTSQNSRSTMYTFGSPTWGSSTTRRARRSSSPLGRIVPGPSSFVKLPCWVSTRLTKKRTA